MRATGLWVGVAGVLALSAASAADENLERAWQVALAQDRGLAAVGEDLASAQAAERAARAQRLPTLNVSSTYARLADAPALAIAAPGFNLQSPRIFDQDDFLNGSAELMLPVYTGGSISAGIRAAAETRAAAEAGLRRATADLRMDVAERYVAVLRTRAARDAAIAQVEALRAHVGDVEAMVEQGAVNRSDLLASRVALANAEQARLRAERSRAEARAAYNRRVGQPLDREPDLAVAIAPPALDEATPLAALQERAVQSRSELDALAAEARAWEARARAESGRQLPQLGLSAGFHRIESTVLDREDFTMVGIGFRWQLFDGGQSRQRARSLRRAGQAAALRRDDLEADIRIEVEQAWLGVAEADARAAAARESVAEADENLRMSREQYTAELVANTQVLDAVALQLAATANARDAVLDAALARLRLARAVGAL